MVIDIGFARRNDGERCEQRAGHGFDPER